MRDQKRIPARVLGASLAATVVSGGLVLALTGFPETAGPFQDVLVVADDGKTITVHVIIQMPPTAVGLAHYTEHLAWLNLNGNKRGIRHSNAWTNDGAVGYWLSGAEAELPALLRRISGIFKPIDLPGDFAEQERRIVLREYEHRAAGGTSTLSAEAADAFLYAGNQIADSVIGTPEEIMALDYKSARTLHAATHRPGNSTLVVTGGVTERQVRRGLRRVDWPSSLETPTAVTPLPFDLAEPASTIMNYPDPDAAPRMIWRRVVTLDEPVQFDLLDVQTALLRDILDTNLPGGISGPLRFDAAVARSFDLQIWPIDEDNVEISFTAAPDAGVSLTELQVTFEAELQKITAAAIPRGNLQPGEEPVWQLLARLER